MFGYFHFFTEEAMFKKWSKTTFKAAFILIALILLNGGLIAQAASGSAPAKLSYQPGQLANLLGGIGEIDPNSPQERHLAFLLTLLVIVIVTIIAAVLVRTRGKSSTRSLWIFSAVFTVLCIGGMIYIWNFILTHSFDVKGGETVVLSRTEADKYLSTQETVVNAPPNDPPIFIPTGVFVQSFEFESANNVTVTGYVWQKFDKNVPEYVEKGFVFPEAYMVESELAYERQEGDTTVVGWYFKTTVREEFHYSQYPFDHQTVWLRMWAKNFDKNIILVPDFSAYDTTEPGKLPGVEKDFVLENWSLDRAYFSYRNNSYNVNFGLAGYTGQHNFPELHYNVDINRVILATFVGYLIPPVIVNILIFAALLIITRDSNEIVVLGSNTLAVLFYLASLFLLIILLHISLRTQIHAENVIYIEYFYFAIYVAVLLVSLDYIFYTTRSGLRLLDYQNNLIPKLLYWPVIVGALLLMTMVAFY
jgi:hypothetical protein